MYVVLIRGRGTGWGAAENCSSVYMRSEFTMTDRGRVLGLLARRTWLRGMIAGGCSCVGEEGAEWVSCESSLGRGRIEEGGLREGDALVTGG